MILEKILQSQGWGSRQECRGLIHRGLVQVQGNRVQDPQANFSPGGLEVAVEGRSFVVREKLYLVMHKPAGYECTRQALHHPSVFDLVPLPWRAREIQTVGRLDQDTRGLLVLTDDGAALHRLISPKHHLPRRYRVTCARAVTEDQRQALLQGVQLRGEGDLSRSPEVRITGEKEFEMVLEEGKYHQVKRMTAAVGNHCEALVRVGFGSLDLDSLGLEEGQVRELSPQELQGLGL